MPTHLPGYPSPCPSAIPTRSCTALTAYLLSPTLSPNIHAVQPPLSTGLPSSCSFSVPRADLASVPLLLLQNVRHPEHDLSSLMPCTFSVPVVVQIDSIPGVHVNINVNEMFPDPRM